MTKPTQYETPKVPAQWADSRETSMPVAVAIHAISGPGRSPEAIWAAPTDAEWDQVVMAVENYVDCGVFDAEDVYNWGCESFTLPAKYTIAYVDNLLVGCVPDGGEAALKEAIEEAKANGVRIEDLVFERGLTLTDDDEDGAVVWRSGAHCGEVHDRSGRAFDYAVRR